MYLHEYQAKKILGDLGIPILKGEVSYTPDQAVQSAQAIGGDFWVVKAQIHAGGRGKGGGIILAHSLDEIKETANKLLNHILVTPQTGPSGELVECVYVEQGCAIEREIYLSLSLNRHYGQMYLVASQSGGMSIEEVAHKNPDAVERILIDPFLGIQPYHLQRLRKILDVEGDDFDRLISNLYQAYTQFDASLIEINPLAVTKQGKLIALDAKMSLDDNAIAYRQPLLKQYKDTSKLTPLEKSAKDYGLSYIKLEGDIACIMNGAGLGMATMDFIHFHGGKLANFLDVGGSADQDRVQVGFQLVTSDPRVKVVLINIFGGIIRCDMVANSIIAMAKESCFKMPIVVRLEGAGSVEAKEILSQSGLNIIPVNSLGEAAEKAIQTAAGGL